MALAQHRRAMHFTARLLAFIFLSLLIGELSSSVQASSANLHQLGTILSVRKELRRTSYVITRYSPIHQFDVYFAIRLADRTYCADYQTVVLDEIDDLLSCNGKDVSVDLSTNKKASCFIRFTES